MLGHYCIREDLPANGFRGERSVESDQRAWSRWLLSGAQRGGINVCLLLFSSLFLSQSIDLIRWANLFSFLDSLADYEKYINEGHRNPLFDSVAF